ncbi:hypothetical protein LTR10_019777 [Elasticomyces elasticus]|uniref:Uncharacterized protein n=1 Tax=Exophiala sideris TaxID=1016849 RepID=A0ABR0JCL5_9EURO|nr:hypothetical protein LTR10_019777 [Elasticomyces elasticus]KAK5032095.1 hypothetical protein LTS07_004717 [Exophiala sideris]KAK5041022.1 hypothetical protein LTR13_003324 [Exophiala sideris]KAK5061644.1 hypothetical protein LTR69_004826 [Exophiala sideris]KAK5184343.1 hypothetical protein LTR44_003016 [Eurotiomycetes sp. CCFEE 6388]
MTRRSRAIWGYMISSAFALLVGGGGLALQLRRAPTSNHYALRQLDLIDSVVKYAGPMLLYLAYGSFDAVWQTLTYWTLAYLADGSPEQAARYVEAFKAFEATGSAIASKVNSIAVNYNTEFGLRLSRSLGSKGAWRALQPRSRPATCQHEETWKRECRGVKLSTDYSKIE